MPYASKAVRERRRAEVRRRDGDGPCALQVTAECRAANGQIEYEAKPPHPRSFEVDHIVSTDEAMRMGWSQVDADALDNAQTACRQCNRAKSTGVVSTPSVRETYVNPRFI